MNIIAEIIGSRSAFSALPQRIFEAVHRRHNSGSCFAAKKDHCTNHSLKARTFIQKVHSQQVSVLDRVFRRRTCSIASFSVLDRVFLCWVGSLGRACVGWDHLGGGAYHVLGGITWAGGITSAGVLTMCWVGSLGRGCLPCVGWDHLGGGAYHVLGITWAGVLTMCWVGSLGRGCLPCVGWDQTKHDVILSRN